MSAPSAINNAKQIIIGATAALGAGTALTSAAFKAATGEVGIFNKEGSRIITADAVRGQEFVIAVSRGATKPPLVSDLIDGSTISIASARVYAPAEEESLAIGYNGTSGLIADVATYAGELYKVSILVHQFMSGTDSEHLKAAYYQSALTDGQSDIALGIAGSAVKNFSREVSNSNGDKPIVVKVLCNAAGATEANNITVVKGESTVLAAGALTAVVGDFIRLGAPGGGATVASDVYKVVSISGLNYTLDRVVATASGTYATGTADADVITAAAGAAANWGVTLTGTPLPFKRDKKRYAKCRFDIVLDTAFGSTAVTTLTSADEGEGTFEAVSQLENFTARFMSESYEMGAPFTFNIDDDLLATSAVAGGGYSAISIKYSQSEVVSFQNEVSPKELIIFVPATIPPYAQNGSANGLTQVLDEIVPVIAISEKVGVPTAGSLRLD